MPLMILQATQLTESPSSHSHRQLSRLSCQSIYLARIESIVRG